MKTIKTKASEASLGCFYFASGITLFSLEPGGIIWSERKFLQTCRKVHQYRKRGVLMPFIRVSVTQKLAEEKQAELVEGLGEAISVIPGKDGRGLIVDLEDGKTIFCGGVKQENFVFADVRYYSNFTYQQKKEFTIAVFKVFENVLGTTRTRLS